MSKRCADRLSRALPAIVSSGLFVLLGTGHASAVPPPRPLEIRLDMARAVVVAKVIRVVKTDSADGSQGTRTTLSVSETLKGAAAKTIESRTAHSPHAVGDSGIWLIDADGQMIWPHGFLPEAQKPEVKRILKILAERKWSGELHGIKAWAGVVTPSKTRDGFTLLFVVKNCSGGDVFLPRANCRSDILTATIRRKDGKRFGFPLKSGPPCKTIHCDRLLTGQLDYLTSHYVHTKGKKEWLPGKYEVTVTYRNSRNGELLTAVGIPAPRVEAWKGELSARPFELVVPHHNPTKRGPQRGDGAFNSTPRSLLSAPSPFSRSQQAQVADAAFKAKQLAAAQIGQEDLAVLAVTGGAE